MGAATAMAGTHLPRSDEPGLLYKDGEAGVWIRQSSAHVHAVEDCTAGVVTGATTARLIPALLALAWKRLPCRQCLPQGILAALRAGDLPLMPASNGVRQATPEEITAAAQRRRKDLRPTEAM